MALLWPALAASAAGDVATTFAKQWTALALGDEGPASTAPDWATPHRVALELATARLHDFSVAADGIPTLLCAPFALHGATVADFAAGHSLVAALRAAGLGRLYVCEWRSATPAMRLLAIDDYVAALNVVVDEIGGRADLIGLCQGGWLALLYAARFPDKIRKLVIAGAPIDIGAAPSQLSQIVAANPPNVFEDLVRLGGGRVLGQNALQFWSPPTLDDNDIHELLKSPADPSSPEFAEIAQRYRHWNASTVDLPGVYYLEVIEKLYRQNALAHGQFAALGKTIDLAQFTAPVYLLAARDDELVAPPQLLALEHLTATPPDRVETAVAPCRHLGLFMAKDVLDAYWPAIARWLTRNEGTPESTTH